jgi:hypothetical protein
MNRRNIHLATLPAIAVAAMIAAAPVHASTLVADGITYSMTASVLTATADQFTLSISGINGATDTEKGRFGVQSFAFNPPANFASATAPTGFTEQSGGLNSGGCDGHGNFFCFAANTTPSGPALAADSTLSFVFDITLSSGSFAGYEPDFKINWVGTKNNYDLVSKAIDPVAATTPLPAALPLFASGLGALGLFGWRRKRKGAATNAAA